MASLLQVENLSKAFGDRVLFDNISFGISENQRVALIAKNGAGKTTLLNIIAGKDDYQSGTISFKRDIRVSFLEQEPQFNPEMTVLEACFEDDNEIIRCIAEYESLIHGGDTKRLEEIISLMDFLKAWDYEARIKQTLSKLQIHHFDKKIGELSGGQIKRIALANALIKEPDLLILDEPTNHLDLEMVEWLEEFLRRSKMALLMVTHDRYFLNRVCNEILEIDQKQMFSYKGNYDFYLEKHAERIEIQNAELAKANNLYKKELDWMRRQPQARATKTKARIDSFYDLEEKVKQRQEKGSVKLEVKSSSIGTKIFEANYISKSYGDLKILDNFHYNFKRYEKMGIVGKNGTGKSTFLKMLMGEIKPDKGSFDIGETVVFGYYSQDGLKFDEQMKVIDVVRNIADEIDLGGGRKMTASGFLQHFLFTPETQYNYVYKLSGGEKRRLYLCTVLMKNPNFLVLDEPTNDLDIVTLNVLEDYLQNFKGCVIVVSHDRFFMDKIVDHLLVFQGDAKIKDFPGNYSEYRDWRDIQEKQESENIKKEKQEIRAQEQKSVQKARKKTFQEKREFEQISSEIDNLETEKSQLENGLSSGTLSVDDITKHSNRLGEIIMILEEKSMRWLELSEIPE